jgi:para-nitrobenzyl esterase
MSDEVVVETTAGVLRGTVVGKSRVFKGVGYAEPPTGARRFKAPQPLRPWSGVRDAIDYGAPSVQNCVDPPNWVDPVPPSEDCLYLNVWAPLGGGSDPKPVMVWIHGGGFMSGSGGLASYDGQNLAELGDVIVVTVNHRLNIFGYLWLGDIDARYAGDGNCGQQDLVAALGWVRANIAAFGGDPGNVTLFGESGGGAKICALLATPSAKGLFHKAIIQSGSQPDIYDRAKATEVALFALEAAGVDRSDLSRLETLSTEALLATSQAVMARYSLLCLQPVIDGSFMPRQSWDRAPDESRDVSLIIGTNSDEGITFLARKDREPESDTEMAAWFAASFGAPVLSAYEWTQLLRGYREMSPDASRLDLLEAMLTDVWMWQGALHQAEVKVVQGGAPVFMYEFGWRTPAFGGGWALHAGEIPFVFGNLTYGTAWDGTDNDDERSRADPEGDRFRLAERMMRSWTRFAHVGDPSTAEIVWPPFDLEQRATLYFNRSVEVRHDPNAQRRALVAGLPFSWSDCHPGAVTA